MTWLRLCFAILLVSCVYTIDPDKTLDPLGCSLTEDSLETSLCDPDPLGMSLLNSSIMTLNTSCESLIPELDQPIFTSTPRKTNPNKDKDPIETSFYDVQQFGTVLATPKAIHFNSLYTTENQPPEKNKLLHKKLSDKNIMSKLQTSCYCGQHCMDLLNFKVTKAERYRFWTKSVDQRKQWLLHTFETGSKEGHFRFLPIDNKIVCAFAFQNIYGISKNMFSSCKLLFEKGEIASKGRKLRGLAEKTVEAINWLEVYASTYGDRMPNSDHILLPIKTLKGQIYESYKSHMIKEKKKTISRSGLQSVWRNHFPNLKIKMMNDFSKCTKCESLERKLKMAICPRRRTDLRLLKERHNQRQMLERKYYYSKRQLSRKEPKKYLSLIFDGMDQSKSNLPHFVGRRAKVINGADLMKTHISGVINHGENQFNTYIDVGQYPHDPNLTVNLLIKTLLKIAARQGRLPPVLFLQADNCWRENKNKVVLAFCELLVQKNIFREVHISYLFVGHTHEDIDAAFSKVSSKLRHNDAETLDDLMGLVQNSVHLNGMIDFKGWVENKLSKVSKHTQPHHFKFSQNGKSVDILYKGQQHMAWKRMGGNGKIGSFFKETVTGTPKQLKPDWTQIDKHSINKQVNVASHLFSNQEKVGWWHSFLSDLAQSMKDSQCIRNWLSVLPKQAKLVPRQQQDALHDAPQLMALLNKETAVPEVICEKRKQLKKSRSGSVNKEHGPRPKPVYKAQGRPTSTIKNTSNVQPTIRNIKTVPSATVRRRKRKVVKVVIESSTVSYIYVIHDNKNHIWFIILCNLMSNLFLEIVTILFILFSLFNLCISYAEYINILLFCWHAILKCHMSIGPVKVNMAAVIQPCCLSLLCT